MIKTFITKKQMTFRELMEYIIQNDVSGEFVSSDRRKVRVDKYGNFNFDGYSYGLGELYKVDVMEEITEDTKFSDLVEVTNYGDVFVKYGASIEERKTEDSKQFYILLDGELVKVWERDSDE